MTTQATTVSVGGEALAALHARELPQKDNLCGCFWGAIALGAAGVGDADQDAVALAAGTLLPEGDPQTFVPPGETPRRDYRLELPTATDPDEGGTSAGGLAHAIEELAGGALAAVPVAGPWTADSVLALVDALARIAPTATLIANVDTGRLWGSRAHPSLPLGVLEGREVEGPPPDWEVGHFVNVAAVVRGAGGALVVVRDTYRSLGVDGHHLQPADAFARALARGDGRAGGILCVVPGEDADAVRAGLEERGFELRLWDNGTPG